MRYPWRAFIAITISILTTVCAGPAPAWGADALVVTGSLAGVARDAGGAPLSGVCVTVDTAAGKFKTSATTNASGAYQVASIAAGAYKATFSDCNQHRYVTTWYGARAG